MSIRTILFLLLGLSTISQARVKYIPIEQLPQKADMILLGKVQSKSTRLDRTGHMVYTDYQIEVQKWYKGRSSNPLILSMAGGTYGQKSIGLSIASPLEVGQNYILFLHDPKKKYANPIVGTAQGAFKLVSDAQNKWVIDYYGYRIEQSNGRLLRGRLTEIDAQGRLSLKPLLPKKTAPLHFNVKDAQGRIVPQIQREILSKRPVTEPVNQAEFEAFIQSSLQAYMKRRNQ